MNNHDEIFCHMRF